MTDALKQARDALTRAEACILVDRTAVLDCHTGPDGIDDDGAAVLEDYDDALLTIRAALAAADAELAHPAPAAQPEPTLAGHFIKDFGGRPGRWHQCNDAAEYTVPLYTAALSVQPVAGEQDVRPSRAALIAALKFYADGSHFLKSDADAWDTVSGEGQNYWSDEAGTATVEDGGIARMTLAGELTAARIEADDAAARGAA